MGEGPNANPNPNRMGERQFSHGEMGPRGSYAKHFVGLHNTLSSENGVKLFRSYIVSTHGMGLPLNQLDTWLSIKNWKDILSCDEGYHTQASKIYDTYLQKEAPKPINLEYYEKEIMIQKIKKVKTKQYNNKNDKDNNKDNHKNSNGNSFNQEEKGIDLFTEDYFETYTAKKKTFMGFFTGDGKAYKRWVDYHQIPPTIFNPPEWSCFLALLEVYIKQYIFSNEYKEYGVQLKLEEETEKLKYLEVFMKICDTDYLVLAKEVKRVDGEERAERAYQHGIAEVLVSEAVATLLDDSCEKLLEGWIKGCVRDTVFESSCAEQRVHEEISARTDEIISISEETIIEHIYEFFTATLLNLMLTKEEYKQDLLECGGFVKPNILKSITPSSITPSGRKQMRENIDRDDVWFTDFLITTNENEQNVLLGENSDYLNLIVLVQKTVRMVIAQRRVRKIFVSTFKKKYDPINQACYYVNEYTQESSWEKPLLLYRLFPDSKW
jgi:hypothetical protein